MTLAVKVLEDPQDAQLVSDDAGIPVRDGSTMDDSIGLPTGVADWRVSVQVLLPRHPGSVVGYAKVGTAVVSEDVWCDVKHWLQGFSVTDARSDWGDHPQPATANITLRSPDHRFAPWAPYGRPGSGHRFRKGCPIRVVVFNTSTDEWHPLFTGEIETAKERTAGNGQVIQLVITAVDTASSRLARVDLNEWMINAAVAGVTVSTAVGQLLAEAEWPYGSVIEVPIADAGNEHNFVADIGLTGNLYEQLRKIADAIGRTAGVDRFGRFAMVRRRPDVIEYSNAYIPAADPHAGPPITLDSASSEVRWDTVNPTDAEDAIVNEMAVRGAMLFGIWAPLVLDGQALPVRIAAASRSTLQRGLSGPSSGSLSLNTTLFAQRDAVARDVASIDRYGLARNEYIDPLPTFFGLWLAERMVERVVRDRADDLWHIGGIELDVDNAFAKAAATRVGSAATVVHEGATFNGYVSAMSFTGVPTGREFRIGASLDVSAYSCDREEWTP